MGRLLIISCSLRKRPDPKLLPALNRYDGPAFRVLRRYLRDGPVDPPRVYVLSAEFGLIPSERPIPWYDRRMTLQRAAELRPIVRARLAALVNAEAPGWLDSALICMSNDYLATLPVEDLPYLLSPAIMARGQPGKKLAILHDWLRRPVPHGASDSNHHWQAGHR